MKIKIFAAGGTIDKVYFDALSEYQVGRPQAEFILKQARVTFEYEIESVVRKDSLDMTDADRQLVRERVESDSGRYFIVTHGTDTMVETANALMALKNKVIVLTGAMQPGRFKNTDADFNLGLAVGAVQALAPGVYIAMSGRVFAADKVKKNRETGRFETL